MLELDYLHRARSPLAPKVRAQLRWVAAHANRCAYGQAYAAADLRPAGPLRAAQLTEEGVWAVVDLPAFGYAWVPAATDPSAAAAPAAK